MRFNPGNETFCKQNATQFEPVVTTHRDVLKVAKSIVLAGFREVNSWSFRDLGLPQQAYELLLSLIQEASNQEIKILTVTPIDNQKSLPPAAEEK